MLKDRGTKGYPRVVDPMGSSMDRTDVKKIESTGILGSSFCFGVGRDRLPQEDGGHSETWRSTVPQVNSSTVGPDDTRVDSRGPRSDPGLYQL